MNRSSKEKELFLRVIKSTVADSLKKRLSGCKKWHLVLSIADSAVAGDLFFMFGNIYKRSIIFIELDLNHDRDEDFKGDIGNGLNPAAHSAIDLFPTTDLNTVFVGFEFPASALNLGFVIDYVLLLFFDAFNKRFFLLSQLVIKIVALGLI